MYFFDLPRAYGNAKRLREIASILAHHGFSHFLRRIRLAEHLPTMARLFGSKKPVPAMTTENMPTRLVAVLQDLGATFIKFGQLLAGRPDLIPPEYAVALAKLQDHVAPVPYDEITSAFTASTGKTIDQAFIYFDPTPLASGSIGQAHRAKLLDGRSVVVKVKRPDTDRRVKEDLALMTWFADLAETHLPEFRPLAPKALVAEFAKNTLRELDLVSEAANAERFAASLTDEQYVKAPKILWPYTSHDTLVMSEAEGVSISNKARLEQEGIDINKLASNLVHAYAIQLAVHGVFHGDPHPGNIFAAANGNITYIDFGQVGKLRSDLQRQIALAILAFARGDHAVVADVCAEIAEFSERADPHGFRIDFADLCVRYAGIPFDRIDLSSLFHELMSIARENGLILPSEVMLLAKSLVTLFSVVRNLNPQFRLDQELRGLAGILLKTLGDPRSLIHDSGLWLYHVIKTIARFPETLRDLMEKARAGDIRVVFRVEGLDEPSERLERSADRLTLGILIAAITVGSSIVLAGGSQTLGSATILWLASEPLPISALVGFGGYALALIMGLYLAWTIMRRH